MKPSRVYAIRLAAAIVEINFFYFLSLDLMIAVNCIDIAHMHVLCVGSSSMLTIGASIAAVSRIHYTLVPIVEHHRLSIDNLAQI